MGSFFSTKKQPAKILVAGLDAAGKTTMLYKLKVQDLKETIPTIGLNVETGSYNNFEIIAWDSGGRMKMGPLKRHYAQDMAGVIWIVDSNDRERMGESEEELCKELSYMEHDLKPGDAKLPVLILANKQDLPNALSTAEIAEKLKLHSMRHRQWHVQPVCLTEGMGLKEGLDWFSIAIENRKSDVSAPCELSNK
jgi:small GTP-binding protein